MKLLKKFFAVSALPLLMSLAAMQPGCGHRGPTDVAQGHRYTTGDPTYDQFFARVHELSVEMGEAPTKEKDARIALGTVLDLDMEEEIITPAAPARAPAAAPAPEAAGGGTDLLGAYGDQLKQSAINAVPGGAQVQGVKQQVDQLKGMFNGVNAATTNGASAAAEPAAAPAPAAEVKKEIRPPSAALLANTVKSQAEKLGLLLKLEVNRDDEAYEAKLKSGGDESNSDARELKEAVEKAAKTELELFVRMEKAKKRLESLANIGGSLEASVDNVFKKQGGGKTSEVRKNVADARALIKLMQIRAAEVHEKADQVVSKLTEVANADLEVKPATDTAVAEAVPAEAPKAEPKAEAALAKPQKSKTVDTEKPKKRRADAPQPKKLGDFEP
jgi:hypothetical protein